MPSSPARSRSRMTFSPGFNTGPHLTTRRDRVPPLPEPFSEVAPHSHRTRDWLVLEAASVSYSKAPTYFPSIDLLKNDFQIEPRDEPALCRGGGKRSIPSRISTG